MHDRIAHVPVWYTSSTDYLRAAEADLATLTGIPLAAMRTLLGGTTTPSTTTARQPHRRFGRGTPFAQLFVAGS